MKMRLSVWVSLLASLWDGEGRGARLVPGVDIEEWRSYYRHDYDSVDAFYIDVEVLGGE